MHFSFLNGTLKMYYIFLIISCDFYSNDMLISVNAFWQKQIIVCYCRCLLPKEMLCLKTSKSHYFARDQKPLSLFFNRFSIGISHILLLFIFFPLPRRTDVD